jgi:hypothetical protein
MHIFEVSDRFHPYPHSHTYQAKGIHILELQKKLGCAYYKKTDEK